MYAFVLIAVMKNIIIALSPQLTVQRLALRKFMCSRLRLQPRVDLRRATETAAHQSMNVAFVVGAAEAVSPIPADECRRPV